MYLVGDTRQSFPHLVGGSKTAVCLEPVYSNEVLVSFHTGVTRGDTSAKVHTLHKESDRFHSASLGSLRFNGAMCHFLNVMFDGGNVLDSFKLKQIFRVDLFGSVTVVAGLAIISHGFVAGK